MNRIAYLIKTDHTLNQRIKSQMHIFVVSVVVVPIIKNRDALAIIILQILEPCISN